MSLPCDERGMWMAGDLSHYSVESYVTRQGKKGFYFLAADAEGGWYWAGANWSHPTVVPRADFRGPCTSKGEAIRSGEDWVERITFA